MIVDKFLQLASAQAVTSADAYTALSYDIGGATPASRIGTGERLSIVFVVTTAAAGDGSPASMTDQTGFFAVEDSSAAFDASPVKIISRRVPNSELVAGAVVEVPIPVGRPLKRYLAGRVELGTDDTITVDAYIMPSDYVGHWIAHAKGYSV